MIVILDNIRSIHNVGSIFRTADALGVEKILLCGITPAPIDRFGLPNKALVKVALGAEQSVPWSKAGSTLEAMAELKQKKYTIIALEQDKRAISVFDLKDRSRDLAFRRNKVALILGSEVEGIAQEILDKADFILEIPMRGKKESLNVSVAFGIAGYFLRPWLPISTW
jgi:tRNA G18 (ribose-2'-O)-methylase SpoU